MEKFNYITGLYAFNFPIERCVCFVFITSQQQQQHQLRHRRRTALLLLHSSRFACVCVCVEKIERKRRVGESTGRQAGRQAGNVPFALNFRARDFAFHHPVVHSLCTFSPISMGIGQTILCVHSNLNCITFYCRRRAHGIWGLRRAHTHTHTHNKNNEIIQY